MNKFIDKILSRDCFFYYTLFYLTCKLLPPLQGYSIFTYIMFFYAVVVFAYNRIIKTIDLAFPCCFVSYGLLAVSIISVIVNGYDNLRNVIVDIIPIFVNMFLFFPTFKDDNKEKLKQVFDKLMICIFFIGLFTSILNIACLVKDIISKEQYWYIGHRMRGYLGNPNIVGWFSVVFLGSAIYVKNYNIFNKYKLHVNLPILIAVVCIVLSQCRSAYLALLVYILFYLFTRDRFNKLYKKHRILINCCIALLLILFLLAISFSVERFDSGRGEILKYALFNFRNNNLILGLGFGKLRTEWVSNLSNYFSGNAFVSYDIYAGANTHNIFLQQLCTNGFLGFGLVLIFAVVIIKKIFDYLISINRYNSTDQNFLNSLCYFIITALVIGQFDNDILQSMFLFINFTFLVSAGFFLKIMECDER